MYFVLNFGGDATQKIAISDFAIEPNYTGFNHPSINDDIAVLTLAEDLPPGVPTYQLPSSDLLAGTHITIVGYGRSGTGLKGYTTSASPVVKRLGENVVDAFYGQDDKGQMERNEVFRFDFDGPKGNGSLGGPTLGNNIETQLGMGDSGGPSLVYEAGSYVVVGVNTFVQGGGARASDRRAAAWTSIRMWDLFGRSSIRSSWAIRTTWAASDRKPGAAHSRSTRIDYPEQGRRRHTG